MKISAKSDYFRLSYGFVSLLKSSAVIRPSSLVPRPSSLVPRPSSLTEFCPHRSGKTTEPIWLKFETSILWQKLARRAKYEMYM